MPPDLRTVLELAHSGGSPRQAITVAGMPPDLRTVLELAHSGGSPRQRS